MCAIDDDDFNIFRTRSSSSLPSLLCLRVTAAFPRVHLDASTASATCGASSRVAEFAQARVGDIVSYFRLSKNTSRYKCPTGPGSPGGFFYAPDSVTTEIAASWHDPSSGHAIAAIRSIAHPAWWTTDEEAILLAIHHAYRFPSSLS